MKCEKNLDMSSYFQEPKDFSFWFVNLCLTLRNSIVGRIIPLILREKRNNKNTTDLNSWGMLPSDLSLKLHLNLVS